MASSKQARHSHFQRGSGTYACQSCGHQTRDTGDNGQCRLCPACYDLAGIDNYRQDHGDLGSYHNEATRLMEELVKQAGQEKAKAAFPEIFALIETAALVEHVKARPFKSQEEYDAAHGLDFSGQADEALEDLCYHVIVHNDDFSVCELLAVPARASRFARRMARSEWKRLGNDDAGLTFNARNAGPENHA